MSKARDDSKVRDRFNDEATIWSDDSDRPVRDLISSSAEQRLKLLGSAAVIGAVLGLGGVLAAGAGLKGMIWLAIVVLGLVAVVTVANYLEAGIMVFLALCWFLFKTPGLAQGQSGGGEQGLALSQLGLVFLLAAWALRRLFGREGRLYKSPINAPILAYLFVCVWSTLHSQLFPDSTIERGLIIATPMAVNLMEVVLRVLALGGLLLIANTVTRKNQSRLAAMFPIAGVLLFLFSLQGRPNNLEHPHGLALFVPGQGYGAFPQMLAVGALVALALAGIGKRWQQGAMVGIALAIFGWAFIRNAEWVSGWLAGGLTLAIVVYNTNRRLFWIGVGIIALIVLVKFEYFWDKFYKMNFYAGGHMNWGLATLRGEQIGALENDRSRMLRAAFQYADAFPLGVGLGNYKNYNLHYGSPAVWNSTTFTSAHGTYAQTLSELGWLGLLSQLWLQVATLVALYRYWRALPAGTWEKPWLLATYAGCWGIFVSAFLGDYIFPSYHNGGMGSFGGTVYVWLFAGLGIGIARLHGLNWDRLTGKVTDRPRPQPRWVRPLEGDQ
ncbi:O-antigen ligase family protein [Armatimonas sp.]|uniref:O-antigen ligase family protein n=1 Tax=Armatimonas sp. TaxID=1872638 RepID=UPI00374DF03E